MMLCDIGNTHFHIHKEGESFHIPHNKPLPHYNEKIYYISVSTIGEEKLLTHAPYAYNLAHVLSSTTSYIGLGIDRQMAIYGIHDGIIVDAGSAITIDLVSRGIHQGGFILPGLRALSSIYPIISSRLPLGQYGIETTLSPAFTTDSAINRGLLGMVIAFIDAQKGSLPVILTGGDGKILHPFLDQSFLEPDRIFTAMKQLIREKDL